MSSDSVWAATMSAMTRIELIPIRSAGGAVVLQAVGVSPAERLRRFVRRLLRG